MSQSLRILSVGVVIALVCPITLWAQWPSDLVGFNSDDHGGVPIDDPATSQEMFQIPQFSGSTVDYILLNDPNNPNDYSQNSAFRAGGLHTEGDAALQVLFKWVDPSDSHAWVRLTTWNGEWYPNPCLDTRGKVRFKITNESEFFDGDIGVCIGIRETGAVDVDQLGDGGTSGPIEWVGVTGVMTDPNYPGFIKPIPAITLPPSGTAYQLEWDLSTGKVRVDSGSWVGTIAGFTGNGTLADCPNNRGTLEHVAITNVTSDPAVEILFAIDELQFEATVPDPIDPPVIQAPVVDTDTEVLVNCLADATSAELFIDPNSQGSVTPIGGVATFSGLSLTAGNVLTATQTVTKPAGSVTSDLSAPVIVYAEGTALAENFDGYGSQDDLELIWSQSDPANDRKLLLTTGSASSCENLVVSDYDPGPTVSKLYYYLGAVNGSNGQPLLVTYRFKHDSNNTNARARFELTSSLSRAEGALGFAFSNGISGDFQTQYTTMACKLLAPDDPNDPDDTFPGYEEDYFGYEYALTGIDREPGVWHKMEIEVLTDVVHFYIDDVLADPVECPTGVPRANNLDFQYIILGVGYSNNGPAMMYDDISVTLGATAPPFGDPNPIESPTVVGPLFPGDSTVDLSDIDPNNATGVKVYADGAEVGSASPPFTDGLATVSVSPALSNGASVTATQLIVPGDPNESCYSEGVIVGVTAPTLESPLVPGQMLVQVSDIEEGKASAVTVYQDPGGGGDLVQLGTLADPNSDPAPVPTSALVDGHTIIAKQTVGGIQGPQSAGVVVAVPAPTLVGPLYVGDEIVTVTDVHPDAQWVTVYVNLDTYPVDPAGADTVYVTVPALVPGSGVRATQTIGGVEGPFSNSILVGNYVFINEFSYDDSGDPDDRHFVELYNSGDDPMDIGDWEIQVGDYYDGPDPNWPGVYYRVIIPTSTVIGSQSFWTVAMSAVAADPNNVVDLIDDTLRLDNGHNYLALRNTNGILLDAVAWETNKEEGSLYMTGPLIPAEIYTQIGTGIWGNHVNWDNDAAVTYLGPWTSQSRYLDGLDTDENGRDFGIQVATPGYSNAQPDLRPYFEDASGLSAFDAVPNWSFSYKPVVAINPGVVDSNGVGGAAINPSAILPAPAPGGGLAMIAWDEEGGGNANYLTQLASENFTLETYIYVSPTFTPTGQGYEEMKIGLRGSADGVHNFDWYNGATGVCWFLQRAPTWQGLWLIDENDGDDGIEGDPLCATILGSLSIGEDPAYTGWQRLLLEVSGDSVLGIFGGTYGSRLDGMHFTATHESFGPGGVYISYRENITDNSNARPPTLDAFSLEEPVGGCPNPGSTGNYCLADVYPNDGDGVWDYAVDGDCVVNLNDLAQLIGSYGMTTGATRENGDVYPPPNGNGQVNLNDLAELIGQYGDDCN